MNINVYRFKKQTTSKYLKELYELSKKHQLIGYKNKDGIWVSRYFKSESNLDKYIKNLKEMIKNKKFTGNIFSYDEIETNISEAKNEIYKAEEEITRRKEMVEVVSRTMKIIEKIRSDLEKN